MLASVSAIYRSVREFLHAISFVPHADVSSHLKSYAVSFDRGVTNAKPLVNGETPPPLKLFATIELGVTDAPEPPDGGAPAAIPLPVLAQSAVLATMYRATSPRPLAAQMAITAARNVPQGRKARGPQKQPIRASASPRRISAIKQKPVVQASKKKSLKRRHVWLSNQSRVIRAVSSNVIQLQAPRTIRTVRAGTLKTTVRQFKLAA